MNIRDYVISLSKFLSVYYNLEGEVLKKVTHEQVCAILELGSIPVNEIVVENVLSGQVLLVKDVEGKILGYKNPYTRIDDSYLKEPSTMMVSIDEEQNIVIGDMEDYSNYELTELIKTCKKAKDDKTKNAVIKELHKRKSAGRHSKRKIRKKDFREE